MTDDTPPPDPQETVPPNVAPGDTTLRPQTGPPRVAGASVRPERVGQYRIVRHLADGGMGSVYEAVHEVTKARVAVKVVRPGFDSDDVLARFDAERQTLARFDHPNIARVYDAGIDVATGRPYFVMEYVPDGLPITEFADANRLTIRGRLQLFGQVCAAVQHAHTKAIIHRDVKPSNVLAYLNEAGTPIAKVIDFGIAKAISGERPGDVTYATQAGLAIGTYEYMSPEQAAGDADLDTRTDVYSLGVLLYELLSGVKPMDVRDLARAADLEIRRVIREVEPPRPSTKISSLAPASGTALATSRRTDSANLARELRRELEWIPLKAIRKGRDRRYASVEQLAADVENYLTGRALMAGPESRAYRAQKFVRRNRGPVLAVAAIALLLVGGLAGTGYGLRRARASERVAIVERDRADAKAKEALAQTAEAERQRQDALTQSAIAREVSGFLTGMFDAASPVNAQGKQVTAVEVVTRAVARLAGRLDDRDLVKASLEDALGRVLEALGRSAEAEPLLKDSLERRLRSQGADHRDAISATDAYAATLRALGRFAEAEPLFADARRRSRQAFGEDDALSITAASDYALLLGSLGRDADAEPLLRDALQRRRRLAGEDDPGTVVAVDNYAQVLQRLGRAAEAEPLLWAALDRDRRLLGPDHPDTLTAANNYGHVLGDLGRSAEAEPLFKDLLERRRRVQGPDHPATLNAVDNEAMILFQLGRAAEAEPLLKEAFARRRKTLGEDHPETLGTANDYAYILGTLGRQAEGEPILADTLARRRRTLGEDHPDTLLSLDNYAGVLLKLDRVVEAVPIFADVLARRRRLLGDDHPSTIASINGYAYALQLLGRNAEAEPLYKEALERRRRVQGKDHPDTITATNNYAQVLGLLGRVAEAEPLYGDALARRRRVQGEDHPDTITSVNNYARVLESLGRVAEAEPMFKDALRRATTHPSMGPANASTKVFARNEATALDALGRPDEAAAIRRTYALPQTTTRPTSSSTSQPATRPAAGEGR